MGRPPSAGLLNRIDHPRELCTLAEAVAREAGELLGARFQGPAGPLRAKMASAAGWAALLFSSWRHLKYDHPTSSGADRVRAFITGDLLDARRMLRIDHVDYVK